MRIQANGIDIEVEDSGAHAESSAPAVLLIMGLGMQLTSWPPSLVDGLIAAGYRVIRFDNRDSGLSTRFDEHGKPKLAWTVVKHRLRLPIQAPYSLADMSADALGVLDALGIAQAHIVGVSMGGMIAQRLAIAFPTRLMSLTSIMSSSGARDLPGPRPAVGHAMLSRPQSRDKQAIVDHSVKLLRMIGSPKHADHEPVVRARVGRNFDRSFHPVGISRQMVAIMADHDRFGQLGDIRTPTLVIHGTDDPLVPFACGVDTAKRIPGAKLLAMPGMGHDLPKKMMPTLCAALVQHFRAATAASS
ncbi:MAG TPA: alpha/beta hydrolase [Rhodocyclaceae bacterium]|nr:alpha/beta hydrolase [Rhodocyclaceae bacterium]